VCFNRSTSDAESEGLERKLIAFVAAARAELADGRIKQGERSAGGLERDRRFKQRTCQAGSRFKASRG
jgi:hypothetical protein